MAQPPYRQGNRPGLNEPKVSLCSVDVLDSEIRQAIGSYVPNFHTDFGKILEEDDSVIELTLEKYTPLAFLMGLALLIGLSVISYSRMSMELMAEPRNAV